MTNSMFCPNCGKRVSNDAKFCPICGTKIDSEKEKDLYPKVSNKYRKEYIDYPKKQDKRKTYKNIGNFILNNWKKAFFIIITVLIIWSYISDDGTETREFPKPTNPKTITFNWDYDGTNYSITEILYGSIYDYYNSNPEKYCWYLEEDTESCFRDFLEEAQGDNTISRIASDIKSSAQRRGLSNDELLELTVAFVQSIPYDDEKLQVIASLPEELTEDVISKAIVALPEHPYEVLYTKNGLCSDKSFLAVSLIQELGYGVALFFYEGIGDEIGHMVPAIKCPQGYSSYNSEYCYAETTEEGYIIGEIPQMDTNTGRVKLRTTIDLFNENNIGAGLAWSKLKDVEIYKIADGNSYQGVITNYQKIQRIESLENELYRLYDILVSLESELNILESNADYYDQQAESAYRTHEIRGDYASYNQYLSLFSKHEAAYNKYEAKRLQYNKNVNTYNNLIKQYNILIESF